MSNDLLASFKFICNATECMHNDGDGGCWIHIQGSPIELNLIGLCRNWEMVPKKEKKNVKKDSNIETAAKHYSNALDREVFRGVMKMVTLVKP